MKRSPAHTPVTDRLAALSEMIRLRICRLLEQEELSVGEVASVVQLPQSTVSRHLKLLSDGRWLIKRAEGTATLYRLVLDDLPPECRSLWLTVRDQLGDSADLKEDARRLAAVLADRRLDTEEYFGRVAGAWDDVRNELFGSSFTAAALLALLPRDWTVADIGCGAGNASAPLAPHVKRVIAIDQSDAMLDAARSRLASFRNVEFLEGPIEKLPIKSGALDAAVCVLVMHHVEDPAVAAKEVQRTLKPGGRILVVDMLEHDRAEYRHTMGHKHMGFSEPRAIAMLSSAGFSSPRVAPLPGPPQVRGPSLYVATAIKPS